jgi:hypothetical protein
MQRPCLAVLAAVVLALLAAFVLMMPPQIVEQKPMANDFSGDSTCKALWRFEPGALLTDSKSTNHFSEYTSATVDESIFVEGAGSAAFDYSSGELYIAESDMSSGFPLGSPGGQISIAGWFYYKGNDYASWTDPMFSFSDMFELQIRKDSSPDVMYFEFKWFYDDRPTTSAYGSDRLYLSSVVPVGVWFHVGLSLDFSTKTATIRLYYDDGGVVTETVTDTFTYPRVERNGSRYFNVGDFFNGNIDEFVVFNDLKTTDDFDAIRSGTYSGPTETADTTWAWKSIAPLARAIDNPPQWAWKMIPPASKWSLPRATPRRDIFICILRKTGLDDYEVPMASMQLRRRDGLPTLVSCVVPDYLTHYAAAEARKDGEIIIMAGSVTPDGTRHISELERATFEHATYDHGANSSSISLSGYRTTAITNPRPVDLTGLTYYGLQADGKRRVRGQINQFLRPGDTAIFPGGSFVVDQIYISVEATNAWMEAAGL